MEKRDQYAEFVHKIQQQKMKELWDNKEDAEWENCLNSEVLPEK